MRRQLYNLNLHALELVRLATDVSPNAACRITQLYAYLEHIQASGRVDFCQQSYTNKTGWARSTIRADLALLEEQGWIQILYTHRNGLRFRVLGLPFAEAGDTSLDRGFGQSLDRSQMERGTPLDGVGDSTRWSGRLHQVEWGTPLDGVGDSTSGAKTPDSGVSETPSSGVGDSIRWSGGLHQVEWGTPSDGVGDSTLIRDKKTNKNSSKNSNKKTPPLSPSRGKDQTPSKRSASKPKNKGGLLTEDQRTRVVAAWNASKPKDWVPIAAIDPKQEETIAAISVRRGGVEGFIELLPKVLELASRDPWWSTKRGNWRMFLGYGPNTEKGHFAMFADEAACQGPDNPRKFERKVSRDIVSKEWWPVKPNMSPEEFQEAIREAEAREKEQEAAQS